MPLLHETGWVNPYGANMGDLIARSGDAAARAAEITAQANAQAAIAKGNAWGAFAQQAGQLPHQIETNRAAREQRDLQRQQREQTLRKQVAQTVGRIAHDSDSPESFIGSIQTLTLNNQLPPAAADHIIQTVKKAGPEGWAGIQGQYVNFGNAFEDEKTVAPGAKLMRGTNVVAENPKTFAPGTGNKVVNGQLLDAEGNPLGAPVAKQETPSEVAARESTVRLNQARMEEIDARLRGTTPLTQEQREKLELEKKKLQLERDKFTESKNDAVELSGDALDLAAKNYVQTGGNLPAMGVGKSAATAKMKIIDRAAELFKGGDLATQRALYDANKSALAAVQKSADAVNAFEQTAVKNLDLFLDKVKNVPDTKIPLLNAPLRKADGSLFGSSEIREMEAARRAAISEVAKVVSSPGLSGQLSDSARHEVESFIPADATYQQAIDVVKTLKAEMANRHESYQNQIKAITERMAKPAGEQQGAPAVGDERMINGQRAKWDGKGWLPVKP